MGSVSCSLYSQEPGCIDQAGNKKVEKDGSVFFSLLARREQRKQGKEQSPLEIDFTHEWEKFFILFYF